MHNLDRSLTSVPDCLSEYDYNTQTWDDLIGDCKSQVRLALVQMQGIPGITIEDSEEYGVRCAYCESAIYHAGHIEHFRRKNVSHHPELTFNWENLFLACDSNKHCGHYKDRPSTLPYNPDHLIKPDEDDPDHYLYFYSSGVVRVREKLSDGDRQRANETIIVFGLNDSSLVGSRAKAVSVYRKKIFGDLDEIASWEPDDREAYLQSEIESTRWQPYATTIKHFLQDTH